MSDTPRDATGLDGLAAGGDLIGLATLGKTAAVLVGIVLAILALSALLRRSGLAQPRAAGRLRVVGATGLGGRERVVIVQVEETWLVLGVGGGRVTKLHELPAREPEAGEAPPRRGPTFREGDAFATRFAKALRHNAGLKDRAGPGRDRS